METLGTLVDKLTVVNLKIWHHEEMAHDKKASDKDVADAKRAINELNDQRSGLVEEIDLLFGGRVTKQFKNYRKVSPGKVTGFMERRGQEKY